MRLSRLDIDGFRGLREVGIEPHARLNLFDGPNGAGKSSVLEALHCLSTGHSFRTRKPRELVARGRDAFTVTARLIEDDGEREHRIGLSRHRDGTLDLRVDYERVDSVASATRLLPVKVLSPDSHALLQEGPEERRRFLDWGVFHVEPRFLEHWRRFRRALSQRNQALRDQRPAAEVTSWDEQLAEHGAEVDACRRTYVAALEGALGERTGRLGSPLDVALRYRGGWSDDGSLADALARNLEHHRRMRTTTDGPHRAELVVTMDGIPVRQELSRGQQKTLTYLMHLAQLDIMRSNDGARAVVLCDDLLSEVDADNARDLVAQLLEVSGQLFIAGVALDELGERDSRLFHMKQGELETVPSGERHGDDPEIDIAGRMHTD